VELEQLEGAEGVPKRAPRSLFGGIFFQRVVRLRCAIIRHNSLLVEAGGNSVRFLEIRGQRRTSWFTSPQ
jgi:hypothetical protein